MKPYILLIFCGIFSFQLAYAMPALTGREQAGEVSLFSFTTSLQTILPNTLSKEITIQSQSTFGTAESVNETFDLEFTSSSPTGLFLGSTGKSASKTMSKNTSNRTFYYKDVSLGDFIISVKATGRDSKQSFIVTQHIIVSDQIKTLKPMMPVSVKKAEVNPPAKKTILDNMESQKPPETAVATTISTSTAEVFTAPTHISFISKIFVWPIKILHFIQHIFIEV